ncbi:uncharacterized protein LOC108163306 [Drosophila miranda]|uniref:uncharacterized protein LOC108163306 n=1 Tax=Drosophila miranda TaxID=7229 RepID=UPI0007E83372|nr:uncharacterized protein LOC108163306 [Drosophila miranda]
MSQQFSGSDDARNAEETQPIVHLNEDCWRVVIDYLDLGDQLRFASSNVCFGEIFKGYASRRYKHIDESLASRINDDYLKQLLPIVGEHLVSYDSELGDHQHLCLLGRHCTSLKNLKINLTLLRGGGDDLNRLNLELKGAGWWSTDVVYNFEKFPCLQKLELKAVRYNGKGLHVLDQLEYLELFVLDGFDAQSLADCWQTMTKLRYLKYGHHVKNLSEKHFEILVTNCKQLERLAFGVGYLDSTVPYELVCHLPRLQHLQVRHGGSLRDSFIEGLINKQGSPLDSLILEGCALSEKQVQHLCNISSLKELEVSCDTLPLADLLKLENLLYLHISMPITTDQILDLLKGLPHLKVLNLRDEIKQFNDSSFVNSVRAWASEQRKQRGKVKIFVGYTDIHDVLHVNPLVELLQGYSGHILINKEPF